jgi:hypothetical protein
MAQQLPQPLPGPVNIGIQGAQAILDWLRAQYPQLLAPSPATAPEPGAPTPPAEPTTTPGLEGPPQPGTPPRAGAKTLQQILTDIGRTNWNPSPPVEETELRLNPITTQYERQKTGTWLVYINDGRGNNQLVKVAPATTVTGKDEQGNPIEQPIGGDSWVLEAAPASLPADTATNKTVTAWDGSIWSPDANGTWQQVVSGKAPNMDEAQLTAINTQVGNIRRDELQRNLQAHGAAVTDEQWATIEATRRARTLDETALQQKIREWEADNRRAEQTAPAQIGLIEAQTAQAQAQAAAVAGRLPSQNELDQAQAELTRANAARTRATTPSEIATAEANVRLAQAQVARLQAETAQIPVQTGLISAQTRYQDAQEDLTRANAERARATLPSDIATAEANVQAARVRIEQARQEMARPVPLALSPEQAVIGTIAPSGEIQFQPSPAYEPKTQAQVALRAGQLQQQAMAMRDRFAQQVQQGTLSQEEANQRFNDWWEQTIEPQRPQLEVAQREAERAQMRADLQIAQTAGQQAISAYQAQAPYRVGPNFDKAINQIAGAFAAGKMPGNLDLSGAFTYPMPDLNQMAQQATAQALKQISPMAASMTGSPMPQMQMPQGMDISSMLNRTSYQPGTTTTVSPGGQVTITQGGVPPPAPAPAAVAAPAAPAAPPAPAFTPPYFPGATQLSSWSQYMPNFGNPQLPQYTFGG